MQYIIVNELIVTTKAIDLKRGTCMIVVRPRVPHDPRDAEIPGDAQAREIDSLSI